MLIRTAYTVDGVYHIGLRAIAFRRVNHTVSQPQNLFKCRFQLFNLMSAEETVELKY